MTTASLTPDDRDALQEIVNVGMGAAGAGLAEVLDTFVRLSIPRIQVVNASQIVDVLHQAKWAQGEVSAVRQAFYNEINGEVIVLFGPDGCRELGDLFGHDGQRLALEVEQEMLLDVSNILVGACMNGVAKQLRTDFGYSAPSILCEHQAVDALFREHPPVCETALLIQVEFSLEARSFICELLIFMPPASFQRLQLSIADFLNAL